MPVDQSQGVTRATDADFEAEASRSVRRRLEGTGDDEDGQSLVQRWQCTGTDGPGVDLLRRRSEDQAMIAFWSERLPEIVFRNTRKEEQGKTLNYEQCDEATRSGLDESRSNEWEKWKKFDAGAIKGQELENLLREGHRPISTRWVEVDKNSHERRQSGCAAEF